MVVRTSAPVVRIVLRPARTLFLPCAQRQFVRGVARATAMARASASTIRSVFFLLDFEVMIRVFKYITIKYTVFKRIILHLTLLQK